MWGDHPVKQFLRWVPLESEPFRSSKISESMLSQVSGGVLSALGNFLSWIAREHCMRNPDAVAKAWESLNPEAPTLADAGRMFSAYGVDYSLEELRYISRHPEALLLARAVAGGSTYLEFLGADGYVADGGFVPPSPDHISKSAWITILCFAITLGWSFYQGATGSLRGCVVYLAVAALLFMMTVLEVVDMRGKQRARRAIELCNDLKRPAETPADRNADVNQDMTACATSA